MFKKLFSILSICFALSILNLSISVLTATSNSSNGICAFAKESPNKITNDSDNLHTDNDEDDEDDEDFKNYQKEKSDAEVDNHDDQEDNKHESIDDDTEDTDAEKYQHDERDHEN